MIRRLLALVVTAALAVGGLGVAAAVGMDALVRSMTFRTTHPQADGMLVILAVGSDEGPPQRPGNPLAGRADGIHILAVDTTAARMTVLDIPRDAAIGGTKVNAHLARGGPQRLEAELEAWSGIAIDHWVVGSFWSLEQIALGLGGIEVDVPRPMNDPFSGTDLQPGSQRLDVGQALAFARDRKSQPDGDVGRTRNQGRMILSALQQMRRQAAGNLPEVLRLVQLFERSVAHDIPPAEVLPMALLAMRIEPGAVAQQTISGPFGTIGGQSVIIPQPGDAFDRIREGRVGP